MLENSTRAGSYEFQYWKGQQNWCFIFSTSLHCSVVKGAPNSVRNVYSEKYCFFFRFEGMDVPKHFYKQQQNWHGNIWLLVDSWRMKSSFDPNLQHRFFPEATHVQTFKHCFLTAPSVRTKLPKKKEDSGKTMRKVHMHLSGSKIKDYPLVN